MRVIDSVCLGMGWCAYGIWVRTNKWVWVRESVIVTSRLSRIKIILWQKIHPQQEFGWARLNWITGLGSISSIANLCSLLTVSAQIILYQMATTGSTNGSTNLAGEYFQLLVQPKFFNRIGSRIQLNLSFRKWNSINMKRTKEGNRSGNSEWEI